MNSGGTGHTSTTTTADSQAGKVRLYEVAKDLGLANKDLVAKVRALGIEVKNHMSNLEPEDVARVKRSLDKERQANLVEERLSSTVIRRRSKDGGVITRPAAPTASTPASRPAPPPTRDTLRDEDERSILARAKEAVSDVVHKVQEVAHEVVEKMVPSTQEKSVEPTVVEPRREEAPRRVVVETRREEAPRVEVRETSRPAPPAVHPPAQPTEGPRVEMKGEPQAPAQPKKDEPVKFGPTGRVIELPLPRIEIRQADPSSRFTQQRPGGGGMPGQRRDTRGGPSDRFGRGQQGKKKPQLGKKQKSTQITTPAAHKRVIKMDESVAVGEIAKQMGVKAPDVLKKLWSMGMTGIMLNNSIDHDTAVL
ncbi:MAG: translation initiation factor IF-2 N-terminal domain-containing protein, partial [Polyangia bacterium]